MKKVILLCAALMLFVGCSRGGSSGNYYEDLDELTALLFDEPRMSELVLEDVAVIEVFTLADSVTVTTGDVDNITIRYYEWLENQFTFNIDRGVLRVTQDDLPVHRFTLTGTSNILLTGAQTRGNTVYHQGWYINHLLSLDKELFDTIEIIIPKTSADNIAFSTLNSRIHFQDGEFGGGIRAAATNGSISAEGGRFYGKVHIQTTNGQVIIADSEFAEQITISTTNGQANVANSEFRNLDVSTTNGMGFLTLLGPASNYDITIDGRAGRHTHNGRIVENDSLNNPGAAIIINLSTTNGSFNIMNEGDRQ